MTGDLVIMVVAVLAGFAFSLLRFRGRTALSYLVLSTMYISPMALMIPLFLQMGRLGLSNTYAGIIITYVGLNLAFAIYLMTTYLNGIPEEIVEAAVIDGCNKLNLLFRIVVPITMPTLSVLFVFFFIWTWNDLFTPLIFLISNAKQTVPLAMALARAEHNVTITLQSSAALLGILPCILFFLIFHFKGLAFQEFLKTCRLIMCFPDINTVMSA